MHLSSFLLSYLRTHSLTHSLTHSFFRQVDGLRQQMASLAAELESERQRLQEQERRTRQVECEGRATSMSWLDERQRLNTAVQTLESQVAILEDAREKERSSLRPRGMYRGKGMDDDSQSSTGSVVIVLTEEEVREMTPT